MSLRNFIRQTHMLIQHGLHVTRASAASGGFERPLELTRLEDRMLFSASAISPIVAEMADAAASASVATVAVSENSGLFPMAEQQLLDLLADTRLPAQADDQSTSAAADAGEKTLDSET